LWGFIWRGQGLDFRTDTRRHAYAADYREVAQLIAERRGRDVEELLRRMMFESRDVVLRSLVELRGGTIDPDRCISDEAEVSAGSKT
jgi:hypothetical protein